VSTVEQLRRNREDRDTPITGERTQTFSESPPHAVPIAARIRVLNATAEPSTYRLSRGICRIGAGEGVDILLDDKTVSRVHAEIELVREGVSVRDLGSRNGTYLYGQRIERAILSLGSTLRVGRVDIEIIPDLSPEQLPLYSGESYGPLIGGSTAMRRVYSLLNRLEGSLANVLITGETGTGKELAARALHEHSHVASGPFVSINCGGLEKNLARSELFGHVRGAFTGAVEARAGAFEDADGGTLFLDEIGELPLDVQPILLRTIEQGHVVRVGETRGRPVKVRLIAATHRDLEQLVREQRFREDLYYRLMVVAVALPPLRERLEDLPLLARTFAERFGTSAPPPEILNRLRTFRFPGNVRELRNVVEGYAAIGAVPEPAAGETPELVSALRRYIALDQPYAAQKERLLQLFVDLYVDALLAHTGGNQSEAARLSGLERSYLNRLVKRKRQDGA
jgi:DNA-binding NtrC family response regulator